MQFKNEDIMNASKEFKDFYYAISENISDDARYMNISPSVNNQYINSSEHHFPLFLLPFHPKAKELARWINSKVGLATHPIEINEIDLNGSVDDENLDILAELGTIHKILKLSKNGKTKREALDRYWKIKELLLRAEREIEATL